MSRQRVLRAVALHAWPALLAVVLTWPLLSGSGHPLARDLVFVPQQALDHGALGLDGSAPRAVPLDTVIGILTTVVDGGVLARVLVPLAVALAGWGLLRALRGAGDLARGAAAGFAVWNPFVVERLALGQWALLLGYGALPWVFCAAARFARGGGPGAAGAAVAWTALASLTPTGGVLACGALFAGCASRARRLALLLTAGVVLQAPWLVVALVGGTGATSDPAGVRAFAPDTEAASGPLVALLGLGGIWDASSEPATRGTWVAVVAAVATIAVVVAGWPLVRRLADRRTAAAVAAVATAGLVLAIVAAVPPGQDLLGWIVEHAPGAGLLRDAQKWLAPAVLVTAACLGGAVVRVRERLVRTAPELRRAALLPLLASPFVLLPDATTATWPTLTPVRLPGDLVDAVEVVDTTPDDELVAVLPWRSYRLFAWGNGELSSDPLPRWSSARVVVSDDLQVGPVLVRGESEIGARVANALITGRPADLGRLGVGRVVVYRDDPAATSLDLAGLEPLLETEDVVVYVVPDPTPAPEVSGAVRAVALTAHGVFAGVGLTGLLAVVVFALVRRRSRGETPLA